MIRRPRSSPLFPTPTLSRSGLLMGFPLSLPLVVHELMSGGSEVRGLIDFLTTGGDGSSTSLPVRLAVVGLRVLSWPLTGLITTAPLAAIGAAVLVVASAIWLGRRGGPAAFVDPSPAH